MLLIIQRLAAGGVNYQSGGLAAGPVNHQGDSQHIVIVNTEGLAAGRVYQQLGDWQVAAGCVDHRFRFTQLGPWPWPGRIERLATSSYGVAYKINFGILGTGHLYAWAML